MERLIQIRNSVAFIVGICILVVGAALGTGISAWSGHSVSGHAVPVYISQLAGSRQGGGADTMGFAPVIDPVLPAVVSITSSRIVKVPQSQNPFFNDPFFEQFFGGRIPRGPQQRERG
jgi:S1-C subfamily serine protease